MTVRRSRLVGLVTAILCVALGAAAVRAADSGPEYEVVRGRLGVPTATESGQVTAADVRVATTLTRSGAVTGTTPGLFVVVRLSAAATERDELVVNESRLLADGGRVYALHDDVTLSAPPGFVEQTDVAFEVDPAAMTDLTLEVWRSEIVHGYQSRVQVHLGITGAGAEGWRAAGQGRSLEPETTISTRAVR